MLDYSELSKSLTVGLLFPHITLHTARDNIDLRALLYGANYEIGVEKLAKIRKGIKISGF